MICRQCGIRIPERYLTLESFSCPKCGKPYYRRPRPAQSHSLQQQRVPVRKETRVLKSFFTSRSTILLIALIIALIYIFAQYANISNASNYVASANPETAEELGTAVGTAIGIGLLMPHVVVTTIASIFNAVGWLANKRWAALTAGILFAVGGALGLVNFFFVLPSMILCFVASSKMKKRRTLRM